MCQLQILDMDRVLNFYTFRNIDSAVFITLKEFMRFNLENKEISKARFNFNDRTARLISLINCKNEKNFLDFLDELKKNSKLNFDLQSYGIKIEEDYKKILDGVNIKRLNNNPVEVNESVIKKILFNI